MNLQNLGWLMQEFRRGNTSNILSDETQSKPRGTVQVLGL
jgi:hypothetical protein